jgi:hypothetical protein
MPVNKMRLDILVSLPPPNGVQSLKNTGSAMDSIDIWRTDSDATWQPRFLSIYF